MEDVLESMWSAVISIGVVLVLTHRNAVQIDARKEAPGARPGEKFSSNGNIGRSLRVTPDGACGCRGVAANLEFAFQQILKTLLVHGDQHEVGALSADLKSERASGQANKDGAAPAVAGAAGYDTLPVFRAKYKGAFDHAGDYADADCLLCNAVGNGFVGSRHDLVDDGTR